MIGNYADNFSTCKMRLKRSGHLYRGTDSGERAPFERKSSARDRGALWELQFMLPDSRAVSRAISSRVELHFPRSESPPAHLSALPAD